MKISFVILLALLASTPSFAEKDFPTSVVIRGLDVYAKEGDPKAAMNSWLKGSALEESKKALGQSNNLRQIQDIYGKYKSYEIIKDHQISKRVHTVLVVFHYQKGPLFGIFQTYLSNSGKWTVSSFNFNTEANEIFPPEIFYGK